MSFLGDQMMRISFLLPFIFILMINPSRSGSPCPSWKSIYPCICTNPNDGITMVVCSGLQNTSHLEEVTRPLKSLIIDNLLILNTFLDLPEEDDFSNIVDTKNRISLLGIFPKKWLAELRVRYLEIQNSKLNGYFLTDDALEGQSDFLTSLIVKNSNLRGHLCSSCGPQSGTIAMGTKEVRRATLLKYVDLSHNHLEVVDGNAFPNTLKELSKIVLSNNKINRINDNAFSNLHQLNHLDLSRNRLASFGRKIFRTSDSALTTLDLSYNSLQTLSEDMFNNLNSLKEIRLSNNLLETLPYTTWSKIPALLERADLRGNFLVCNCTMNWVARRSSKNMKLLGQCVSPKASEFQELKPTLASIITGC